MDGKLLTIPFDATAQAYYSFIEKGSKRYGTCGPGLVDAQPTEDHVCNERGSDCNIGWTENGEEVTYLVNNEENSIVEKTVILRLASLKNGREASVHVEGFEESKVFEAPGNGYQAYDDFTWEGAKFFPGTNRLTVKFHDQGINFCSVSVK